MIRISTVKEEGMLQASKWLKCQVLLGAEEMASLLEALGAVYFAQVAGPILMEDAVLSKERFLQCYERYANTLKEGEVPEDALFRPYFSTILTNDLSALYAIAIGKERYLVKAVKPVIQLQAHHFFYSDLDQAFHPMVLSQDSVSWGIQFSFPQWVQDPKTHQIQRVNQQPEFTNTALFSTLMRWMRGHTLATPFIKDGKKVNAPIRIGKKCLGWISAHPQLKQKKIEIS